VIGGIGTSGAATASVISIAADGHARVALRLPRPLSDAGVATAGGRIVVVGGSSGSGPVTAVLQLRLVSAS
jgi:hypothetical protein